MIFFLLKVSQDDMRNGNLKIDNADKFSFSLVFLISFSFLRGFDEAAFSLKINFFSSFLCHFDEAAEKLSFLIIILVRIVWEMLYIVIYL